MKILLHSILAGPTGVRHPGVHDVPDTEGQHLVDEGYAEVVPAGVDTASLKPTEFATMPQPRVKKIVAPAVAKTVTPPAGK